jgi:acylphosphatase
MIEIYCIATGKVQGVAYRDYMQTSAGELGLCGWTQNMPDGTVAVCAQGLPDDLKDFVEYVWEGSLKAKVDSVSIDWRTAKEVFEDFSIIH